MNTYKITNITDKLGKRDVNANSTLNITYNDEMEKKVLILKPKEVVYYSTQSLPLSIHKFRIKNLISVEEISDTELNKLKNSESKKNTNINHNSNKSTTSKKKSTTKSYKKSTRPYKKTTKSSTTSSKKSRTSTKDDNE